MQTISVSAVQMKSDIGNPIVNTAKTRTWIDQASGAQADFVVFPECSLTGYSMEHAAEIALDPNDECISDVESAARNAGMAIGYGFIEREPPNGPMYVTYVIASRDSRLVYRKTHLGTRERKVIAYGNDLNVIAVNNVLVGVQLCWESHIPDITSTLRAKGAQLVVMPHAGGLGGNRRLESWARYLPARALDNGIFVAACNAIQRNALDEIVGGGTAFYGPGGNAIAQYGSIDEHMTTVSIGGTLPREEEEGNMHSISYFDRRRLELYL